MHRTTRSREEVETGRRDRHLMNVAMTSTEDLGITDAELTRVAVSTIANDVAGAPSHGSDLDEASRLIRSLVARAEHLDDLWSQHGPDLIGFQVEFAALFENVERAVADLIRTGLPTDRVPTLEGDV